MVNIIHVRWGLSSRQVDIEGWTIGEIESAGEEKKRILVDPSGKKWIDYIGKDGKHDLQKIIEKKERKEDTFKEEKLDEPAPEKLLYDYITGLNIEFCIDQFSNSCVLYNNKYYLLNSVEFRAEISKSFFLEKQKLFGESTWNKFIHIVSTDCLSNEIYFPIRCHTDDNHIYYDTGISVWKFGCDQNQGYTIESDLPIKFRRYKHQQKADIIPTEERTKDLIKEITDIFNIDDFRPEIIPLLFCSNHPNPIYLFTGEPGSAKSTFSSFLKKLVDPDHADKPTFPEPKKVSEFGMHRQHFYLIEYDNVRSFSHEQSDELCKMVTGGATISRKLYTDGELFIMKGLPRIIINGLRPEPSQFNDLLDRSLLFDMRRIKERMTEKIIWSKLNAIIPRLRFACLRDMSNALTLAYEQEFPNLPRMSDYCLLGESLNVLWGGELGSFVNWFNKKMNISHASGMDDPLMVVLVSYLEDHREDLKKGISCSISEWRFKLVEYAEQKVIEHTNLGVEYEGRTFARKDLALAVQEKDFPKNAIWLGRRLRDVSPLLSTLGYSVSVRRGGRENTVEISKN